MFPRFLSAVSAVCCLSAPSLSAQSQSSGPLAVRERSPIYALFYVPAAEPADVIPGGVSAFDITLGYSNIFERTTRSDYDVLLDVERLNTSLSFRRGLGRGVEVGGEIGVQTDWGGFLDPLVQGLHDTFGLPNGDRDLEPQGQTVLELKMNGAPVFEPPIRRLALDDARLFAKWSAYQAPAGALAARVVLDLPTGSAGNTTGLTDVAFEALLRRSWTNWHVHGLLGWTSARTPKWAENIGSAGALLGMVSVERSIGGVSLLTQFATSGRYLERTGVDELDDPPSLLAFGVAGGGDYWAWELGFVEDVPPNGPSVDFTVHFKLRRTWP